MAKQQQASKRLHPRLRVIRNATDSVNAQRAQISACVASTWSAKKPAKPDATAPRFAVLQAGMRDLSADRALLSAGKLSKRRHLNGREARDAYVNVMVEVERDAKEDGGGLTATAQVKKEISKRAKTVPRPARSPVLQRRNFIAATVPVDFLPELERDRRVAFVHRAEPLKLDVPAPGESKPRPRSKAVGSHRGRDVLIGIIDVGGFDFAHPDFLDSKGETRFLSIWDQGGDFRKPPEGFSYGAEFKRTHLNAAIKAAKKKGGLPATLLEPQSQRTLGSHGTHVASIAAGKTGVCPDAKIAAVLISLPPEEDPFLNRRLAFSDTSRIVHAVEYLLDVAKDRPISINISLGTNGGAHDGSSGVSRWLDALLANPGRSVCVAAGNAGQEGPTSEDDLGWIMGRIHTSGRIPARGLDVDLEWTVVGNGIADVSENELELWYSAQDRFTVQVLPPPPNAQSWLTVAPGQFIENKRLLSGCTVSIYNELYNPTNGENYIAVYLSPNLESSPLRGVDAGVWKVRLHGDEIRDGRFHGWVERDDPGAVGRDGETDLFRFPSFFSTASNVDSHSISSLACGFRVVSVANLDEAQRKISITSSQGPTRDGRQKPDVAASGTDVVAAKGFAGEDDLWISMSGTSMAAPYVTGVIGLMLQARSDLTSAQCASILRATAQPLPGASYEWRNDSGFGCVAPKKAIEEAATFGDREEIG